MSDTNTLNSFKRAAGLGLFAAGALLASQAALACQTTAWSSTSGAVAAGDPAVEGISRYQGLCGLEATGQGFVQDNSPGGIDRIVARFYVLNELDTSTTSNVYSGYSATDGTGERFSVTLDDTALSGTVKEPANMDIENLKASATPRIEACAVASPK